MLLLLAVNASDAAARPARSRSAMLPSSAQANETTPPVRTPTRPTAQARPPIEELSRPFPIGKAPGPGTEPEPRLIGAATVFTYNPASAYSLNGVPGFITIIVLEPGERLLTKALGAPESWAINEAVQGTGGAGFAQQQLIYVKPKAPGAATNLVLTTDRRSYQIELTSDPALPRTRMLGWNFNNASAGAAAPRQGSPQ